MASITGVTLSWLAALDKVEGVDVVSDGHSYGVVNAGGTNIPRRTWFNRVQISVAAGQALTLNLGANGLRFATGIAYTVTGAAGLTNNTAGTGGVSVAATYI